jgi:predicted TIM-barrel fold metal-dependent hydrolase
MIIDIHAHILEYSWLPPKYWIWLEKYYQNRGGHTKFSFGKKKTSIIDEWSDPCGKKLLGAMAKAGIDQTVVLPLDWGLLLGEPPVSIAEQNIAIGEISKNSKGKIIAFVGVDPRRKNAIEIIEYCLKEYRMRGIKLYPAAGYDLQDEKYKPVFEKAMEYQVPIIIHSGYSFGPFLSKYCTPLIFDYLCATYPQIKIIAAHLGGGFLEQFCWLGYAKSNLYTDCSLLQIRSKQSYQQFAQMIRFACDFFSSSRIFFGTDWPFSQSVMKNIEYISLIKKLSSIEIPNIQFANYEVKQILGQNAYRMLSLNK